MSQAPKLNSDKAQKKTNSEPAEGEIIIEVDAGESSAAQSAEVSGDGGSSAGESSAEAQSGEVATDPAAVAAVESLEASATTLPDATGGGAPVGGEQTEASGMAPDAALEGTGSVGSEPSAGAGVSTEGAGATTAALRSPDTSIASRVTASTPASGVDWDGFFDEHGLNILRSGLEVARLIPGAGLWAGLGADLVEGYQNVEMCEGAPKQETFEALMYGRQAGVIITNAVSHVQWCVQVVQDVATASVIGVEIDGVTIPLTELLASFQAGANTALMGIDLGIAIAATVERQRVPPGSPEAAALSNIERTFYVNSVSDAVNIFFNLLDIGSLGFANTPVFKQVKDAMDAGSTAAQLFKGAAVSTLNSWFSIWGPTIMGLAEDAGSATAEMAGQAADAAPGMARDVAADIILAELGMMELNYQLGSGVVDAVIDGVPMVGQLLEQAITDLTDVQDPFVWLRDNLANASEEMTQRMSDFLEISSLAGDFEVNAAEAMAFVEGVVATLATVVIPNVPEPTASDFGDSLLADAAEWLVDRALQAAQEAAQWARDELQSVADAITGELTEQMVELQDKIQWVLDFLELFQAAINEQTAQIAEMGQIVAERLRECQNPEDVVNILLNQIGELLGQDDVSVESLLADWEDLKTRIEEGFEWARGAVEEHVRGEEPEPERIEETDG